MVEAGLQRAVAQRSLQAWGDDDVPLALEALGEALKKGAAVMSSWDKYKKEVRAGGGGG